MNREYIPTQQTMSTAERLAAPAFEIVSLAAYKKTRRAKNDEGAAAEVVPKCRSLPHGWEIRRKNAQPTWTRHFSFGRLRCFGDLFRHALWCAPAAASRECAANSIARKPPSAAQRNDNHSHGRAGRVFCAAQPRF